MTQTVSHSEKRYCVCTYVLYQTFNLIKKPLISETHVIHSNATQIDSSKIIMQTPCFSLRKTEFYCYEIYVKRQHLKDD